MSLRKWAIDKLLGDEVERRVHAAVKVLDDGFWRDITNDETRRRPWHKVRSLLEEVDNVYDENPLAARLVGMTVDFVIGAKVEITGPQFVHDFWKHPLNHMDTRIYKWANELSRTGEIFIVLSRNAADKMSYVREVPAILINEIETAPGDLEQELRYHQLTHTTEGKWWDASHSDADQIMLHYAINRKAGEVRGRSDLAQVLPWLERYDMWLEDRVRINRYKGAYLWHVTIEGAQATQLEAKRNQYSTTPRSGSIIVTDGTETWEAIQPKIDASDVEADGKAIRMMIAAGVGVPLHFLAEGESATRATAREMGTATFRHFAARQRMLSLVTVNVLTIAAHRADIEDPKPEITVAFEDVLIQDRRTDAGSQADSRSPANQGK